MPAKTIAYLRVSTDKQADRGVSLDAQRTKLKAYAELYELELVEIIVDAGISQLDRGLESVTTRHRLATVFWWVDGNGIDPVHAQLDGVPHGGRRLTAPS